MKKRVCIETTVVSYFTGRPSRGIIMAGHQENPFDSALCASLKVAELSRYGYKQIRIDQWKIINF
jgi:hypothetical protein